MTEALRVVQLSYAFDRDLPSPEALVARYETLGDWSAALLDAGAASADVLQRFRCDADLRRGPVALRLRRAGGAPRPRPWTPLGRLHAELRALAPQVVHVNGLVHPWPLPALRRALPGGTALVLQDHAAAGPPRGPLRRRLWRWALQGADAFLFTSAAQAEPWRAAGLIAPGQAVHALPEASRRIAPGPRDEARARTPVAGRPALLWVGRLHPVKDPLCVLAGLRLALPDLPEARLTMVFATQELLAEVRACCAAAPELQQRVTLVGRVEPGALPAYYSAADAFVLGSRKEGSGFALLEALGCGLLPVVTDIPAFRALADDGRQARLWAPGDPAACAAALRGLARDPEPPETRAARRAYFERELSWPAVGRRALAAYAEALGARRQKRGA